MVTCIIHLNNLVNKVNSDDKEYLTNLVSEFKDTQINLNDEDKLKVATILKKTHRNYDDTFRFELIELSTKTYEFEPTKQSVKFVFEIVLLNNKEDLK